MKFTSVSLTMSADVAQSLSAYCRDPDANSLRLALPVPSLFVNAPISLAGKAGPAPATDLPPTQPTSD